jgi:predicted alpha/beta superfamily hydrolase
MNSKIASPLRFTSAGKTVEVYKALSPARPIVYLNTFAGEGGRVYEALRTAGCPDFTLAAVSGLDWDRDMAPWDAPPITKNDSPCTGGADEYLRTLTEDILPAAERLIPGGISWRGIAGYSLAGLFAVYSLFRTKLFSRAASMSGSLWFPGFLDFVASGETLSLPEHIYFSLGDREAKTRNPYLSSVQERTERIEALFADRGADTVFELNAGNHYQNAEGRTAAGIEWILNR